MRLLRTTLIIFLFASCGGDTFERNQLPGRYIFTHWNHDTIDINDDGSYRHYTSYSGKSFENTGTWKLNSTGNEIQFENFSFHTDSFSGNWFSRIDVDGDEIHLIYANDIKAYFKKVSQ